MGYRVPDSIPYSLYPSHNDQDSKHLDIYIKGVIDTRLM